MLTINRKIRVKIIVTAEFKKELLTEIQLNVQKIDAELSFLEQRAKKTVMELTIKGSPQVQAVREQLDWEKKKRDESRTALLEQASKIQTLEEGVEILQREVDGPIEIKVGDNWDDIFTKEIVLKDGMVVEIR